MSTSQMIKIPSLRIEIYIIIELHTEGGIVYNSSITKENSRKGRANNAGKSNIRKNLLYRS